jgi:protein-disulfide isomerase
MEQDNSTTKLIVFSVLGGILLLILAIIGFQGKEEPVSLPIKFEQFTDFQCPACAFYHDKINSIVSEFGDNVDYQFINYPLLSLHPNVKIAHQAGVAASNQGMFKEYSDLLFANQDAQSEEDLIKYAQDLGLDMEKFQNDLKSEETIAKVDADMAYGMSKNINYTPAIYINNERLVFKNGEDQFQVIRDRLSELIARAQ